MHASDNGASNEHERSDHQARPGCIALTAQATTGIIVLEVGGMNWKFMGSVVASAVTIAVTNGVIYALFYHEFLANNSGLERELFEKVQRTPEETLVLPSILAMILIGTMISAVVHFVKARTFVDGVKACFVFGCLMVGTLNMGLLGTTRYYSYLSGIVDIFVAAVTFALAGGFAAIVLRKNEAA